MTTMTARKSLVVSSTRAASLEAFRTGVRNNLSRLANLIGADDFDRDELTDMADGDRVLRHWETLLADPEVRGRAIPEWVWSRHARAATRECTRAWGRV
jgi:hypothetical protein